eukprot:gene13586-biopygen8299
MRLNARTMLLKSSIATTALLVGLAMSPLQAKVLAKVDNVEITEEDFNLALQDLGPTLPQQADERARSNYVMEYLIDSKLVARIAEKEKLFDNPDYKKRLAYLQDKALMETKMGQVATAADTEANLKKTYDDAAAGQKDVMEVHARHILVPTEEEAKAALARVKAGEDFAKVADEVSKDTGSKGGDLGFFTKDKMVPEFADAAFKLAPGTISDPVKSQFGWHIIKVEEKRPLAFPAFDTVKEQVKHYVIQRAQADMIMKLHDGVKIERFDQPTPADLLKALPAPDAKPADAAKP